MFLVLKNETKFPIRLKRCSFVENRRAVEKRDSFVISICFRRVLREWFLYHENSKLELLSESNFRTNFLHERANSSCKNSRLEIVGKRKGGNADPNDCCSNIWRNWTGWKKVIKMQMSALAPLRWKFYWKIYLFLLENLENRRTTWNKRYSFIFYRQVSRLETFFHRRRDWSIICYTD